jgi:putative ABC transport system permease protein
MIISYLKIAFRYLLKNRLYTAINLFGLTLGFVCFIVISLYIFDELNFDMFHPNPASIFRVIQHEKMDDGTVRNVAPVAARIGEEFPKQYPEVKESLRISALGRITMGNDPATRDYEPLRTADENFFTFFNFPLVAGSSDALLPPRSIVISEKLATKYFGKEPALGKQIWTSLEIEGKPVYMTVTGVMKDFPKHSHLQFEILFSESTLSGVFPWYNEFMATDWKSNSFITYLKIDPDKQAGLEKRLAKLVQSNYPADSKFNSEYSFQPINEIHLHSDGIQGGAPDAASMKPFYLYLFGAVAILILVIACLNYMNLSTAAAFKRTKEIGTRKTLGAMKSQLIVQFVGEAVTISIFSLALAIAIIEIILPFVNTFTDKEVALGQLSGVWIAGMAAVVMTAGLMSAFYPAWIISRVKPAEALKKDVRLGNKSVPVRKMLVVAQFAISIMMIASTLMIYRQLSYLQSKDIGINVNNLLVTDINSGALRQNFENVKAAFAAVPEVLAISTSTRVPGEWKSFPISTVKAMSTQPGSEMVFVGIDQDFLKTYQIQLKAGRNFADAKTDSTKVILTEMGVKALNLTDPIGQVIEIPTVRNGGSIQNLEKPFRVEVIGVVEDFHFESLRQSMMPVIFGAANTIIQRIDYYTMRIETSDWNRTLAKLKEVNQKIDPNSPLEYTFLDDRFESFYQADAKRGQIFLIASCVIVGIACLGLFALVSYSIETRTKEIGIRKVLGASVNSILMMVAREFLKLVIVASIIAVPIAYYIMDTWLKDFAYRVPMNLWVFLLAGLLAVVIAFVTVTIRSLRAATANPVTSLRNE